MVHLAVGAKVPERPVVISDPREHSMGASMFRYVQSRVHEFVDEASYRRVVVLGSYNRSIHISSKEKIDKLENWQRPTAEIRGDELLVHCFPGRGYVFHYGSLIATHLSLTGRDPDLVRIELPTTAQSAVEIDRLGYSSLRASHTLVVASGNEMLAPQGAVWVDHGAFLTRRELVGSQFVTWLAVKHSFWGDIAFHMGRALAVAGFSRIIFVGKLGSLVPEHKPNVTLVTGSSSSIDGKTLAWSNLFDALRPGDVIAGRHVTLPSVLQETIEWVAAHRGDYDYVDPEIGNFAAGVLEIGSSFSYLHLVSDNLSKKYEHDLSNERAEVVRVRRREGYTRIAEILGATL